MKIWNGDFLETITWFELRNQNVQTKAVYFQSPNKEHKQRNVDGSTADNEKHEKEFFSFDFSLETLLDVYVCVPKREVSLIRDERHFL